MKHFLSLATALACSFALTVQAVEPKPTIPGKEESKESIGTIKRENRPAVPAEALDKADPAAVPTPATEITPAIKKESDHLFGVHAALGVPHPLSAGINYVHTSRLFSAEVSAGSYSGTFDDTKVTLANTELALRWHPWASSFFVGALVGNQKITAEKTEVISGNSVNAQVDVKSQYITPHFGWMWGHITSGFFTSIEFGYQSPSGVKTDLTTNADNTAKATTEYQNLEKDVKDQGDKIGGMGLPHIVLLKIGWLF